MNKKEYRAAIDHVIYLASCSIKEVAPDPERISSMNIEHVYEAAGLHMLAAVVGMALESAGFRDPRFRKAAAEAQRRTLLMNRDRALLLAGLEREGIWYMPLKGVVLQDLYPQFGMREMADNDILIDPDRTEDVRRIMVGLGFSVGRFGRGIHDTYYKAPVSNFEIHRRLVSNTRFEKFYAYYESVKDRLLKDSGNLYGYHFPPEDFYLYLVMHEYKHFSQDGTGLRSLLDLYVYLRKTRLDLDSVHREAAKMDLAGFEQENRELAQRLFEQQPLTPDQETLLDHFLSDGAYGNPLNRINRTISREGKAAFFFSRLFLPLETMQNAFPLLKKVPVLYPLFWIYRMGRGLTLGRKKAWIELKAALGIAPVAPEVPSKTGSRYKSGGRTKNQSRNDKS